MAKHTDVWSFYEALGDGDRSALGGKEQQVAAICDLRQEVNSGGFDSYLRYWGGNTAPEALDALPAVLGPEWANVLEAAMAVLGPDYPREPDARHGILDALEPDDELDALDRRYFELEAATSADAVLSAYLAH